jgi:hypothetical protein
MDVEMKKIALILSFGLLFGCATSNVANKSLVSSAKPCTTITLLSDPVVISLEDPPDTDIEEYVWGDEGNGVGLYRNNWTFNSQSETDATGTGWKRVKDAMVESAISSHAPNLCKRLHIRIADPKGPSALRRKGKAKSNIFTPWPIRRLIYTPIDGSGDQNIKFQ